jgi:hypothetical protein
LSELPTQARHPPGICGAVSLRLVELKPADPRRCQ